MVHTVCVLIVPPVIWLRGNAIGQEWPEFRGGTGQGHSDVDGLPTVWSRSQNVAWRQPLPGKGWSSPILYAGRIFLTTAVEIDENGGQSLRALCLDAETGEIRWNVEAFKKPPGLPAVHAKNSYASPTPITDGERVFVHFGPSGTAAFAFDGNLIWANDRIVYDARHGGGGSPILSGRALIFNCDGVENPFVVALDRSNGKELWRSARPEMEPERFAFSTPLEIRVNGKVQVVSPGSHGVYSYEPATGQEVWRVHFPNKWSVIPRPVFAQGKVFICTGYEGPAELLAIRPDGAGDVTATHVAWRTDKYVPHTPSPSIVGDLIFMVSDSGIATCRNVNTGKLHWRKRLEGSFSASPLHAAGNLYFPNEEGACFVIKAAPEFKLVAKNDLEESTLASYAAGGKGLYIRTAEALYRVSAANAID